MDPELEGPPGDWSPVTHATASRACLLSSLIKLLYSSKSQVNQSGAPPPASPPPVLACSQLVGFLSSLITRSPPPPPPRESDLLARARGPSSVLERNFDH